MLNNVPEGVSGSRAGRRAKLAGASLYLVTDARRHIDPDFGELARFADAALSAGVDIIQLRDKGSAGERSLGAMEAAEELAALAVLREVADRHGKLLAVNDRADIAVAAGADVLHTGQKDLPVAVARRLIGPDMLLGKSCNNAGQVDAAAVDPDLDYFCTGPVWATPTKPGRPAAGLDLVRHAAGVVRDDVDAHPFFAIGSIDPSNAGEVAAAGASKLVVVRALTGAADDEALRANAAALRAAVGGEAVAGEPVGGQDVAGEDAR
ncbi:thiamine phosphate synthase [Corynebacterium freneyi]|uniref:thiamine phosphate synthase n=1 Tax=Corynebacterium freneyi TaxID=134034 RepID=UPI00254AA9D3|nr:thiamine phosphate synthase [Corynebacterium freneyi]MDK8767512.1 thiamine phosphate synthase [Corynebacterium freneyi]